ncbi:acylneuraminate cytidylyltransferase family protein [Aquimarina algicola]|uniref:Acylneuraminate cytidylyltransferase family protein n=1 Tax=Aquimarina algicola TaxID=2589995 RepID=A0A504JJ52_9FLAO|nr:acylneuraminate cytidylyltransferase family protein [Aquimarina algicola]TPN87878.1 acylneuraminate cytidylyltransferase family protein [Aquimarina algicola]
MKALVVIPARGGSKGIPKKNIKPLNGKPLISYTIESALQLFSKEDICISTDCDDIAFESEKSGLDIHFKRPTELATDTAGTHEVLLHAINFYEEKGNFYDTLVLLQPTSPFRKSKHIKEALELYNSDVDMVVSVKESKSNPYYNLFEEEQGLLKKSKDGHYTRRQDIPKVYEYNGAIYIINIRSLKKGKISAFNKVKKYVMDEISSMDLDNHLDWKICELLIKDEIN